MKLKMTQNKPGRVFFVDENGNRFNKVGYYWSSGFFNDGVACVAFKKMVSHGKNIWEMTEHL